MSRKKKDILIDKEFAVRFKEICGTTKPTEIKNRFGFSYQAARNYINGNYPETSVLLTIAQKTDISIHWLLTGEGEKSVSDKTPIQVTSDNRIEIESLIRQIFLEEIGKFFFAKQKDSEETENNQQSTVLLRKKEIKHEKTVVLEEKKN